MRRGFVPGAGGADGRGISALGGATGVSHELLDGLRAEADSRRETGVSEACGGELSGGAGAPDPKQAAAEWEGLRKRFADLLEGFTALAKSSPQELDRAIETGHEGDTKVAGTLEAVLWQMVAHNSYHTGQIAMIRRALGAWPPRGGGDSW